MSLPDHWVTSTVGNIFASVGGGTPSTETKEFWGGTTPWISSADIDDYFNLHPRRFVTKKGLANSPATAVPADSVIVVTRVGLGKVGLVRDTPTCFSQDCQALLPSKCIDPRFAAYQLKWLAIGFLQRSRGTTIAGITKQQLIDTPLSLPPLPEQVRIADSLDELLSDLDAGIAAMERVRVKLGHYRASVLKAAVEGTLTTEWRQQHLNAEPASELLNRILAEHRSRWEEEQLRRFKERSVEPPGNWKSKYKEPEGPNTANLSPLPEGWRWASIYQCGNVQLGRQRAPQHHYGDHMRPYLRVANVFEDRLDLRDVKQMNFTPEEFKTFELRYGDILLNEGQSPELVGRPAMYRDEIPGCCYQKTLLRFRAYSGVLERYALCVFRAYLHNGRFRKSASITTSIAHLAAERFILIEFPLPPIAEQEAIVDAVEDHLSVIDRLGTDFTTKLTKTQALRHSILRHAFSGQLVSPNPNDEPALELLNRITTEREMRKTKVTESRNCRQQTLVRRGRRPRLTKNGTS